MDMSTPMPPAVFYVLLALVDGPSHGYGLMRAARSQAHGTLRLGTGSFYRHLAALIDDGLIAETAPPRDDDPRRGRSIQAHGSRPAGARRRTSAAHRSAGRARLARSGVASRPRMTSPTPGDRAKADRVYALLLHAYPTAFRARFEISMRDTFAHEHAAARARGSRAALLFWPAVVLDTGWSGARARATALARAFRTARTSLLQSLAFDVRDAARALGATPVVSLMAVLSVALGVGANTALFSIVNSLVLKVLPVRAPEQLLLIDHGDWTNPIWEQIRAHRTTSSTARSRERACGSIFRRAASPIGSTGAYVSGRMFDVLGVPAIRGRVLADARRRARWRPERTGGRRELRLLAATLRRLGRHRWPASDPVSCALHDRRGDAARLLRARSRPIADSLHSDRGRAS